jgi:hypothetical protein
MLRMSTGVVTLFVVSLAGLACTNRSGLDLRGDSGGQRSGGSGGQVGTGGGTGGVVGGLGGAGGTGGNQAGSGGISGAGGCIPPPCVLLECPYGYAPSSSPCGCGECAPPPDAGAGGAGPGGAISSGGKAAGGTGGTSSCASTAVCFLPACLGGEFQPNPSNPCGCPICVTDGGTTTDGGKKDAAADSSPDLHVCGPLCNIYCPYGNVLDSFGCPTCQCKPAPGCPTGSHAVTCPPDSACTLDCSEYQRGSDGCQLCACRAPATCAPPGGAACIYCPFGYRSGPSGCNTCSCADPPMGCAANSSDAGA